MLEHLKYLNPLVLITTETEARASARAGAVGLFVLAGSSLFSAIQLWLINDVIADEMRRSVAAAPGQTPESAAIAEAMAPMMAPMIAGTSMFFAIAAVVLGIVQWRKLTRIIPLLILLFVLYSLASTVLTLVTTPAAMKPDIPIPVWSTVLGYVASFVQLALLTVGFRGGSFLHKQARLKATQTPA